MNPSHSLTLGIIVLSTELPTYVPLGDKYRRNTTVPRIDPAGGTANITHGSYRHLHPFARSNTHMVAPVAYQVIVEPGIDRSVS